MPILRKKTETTTIPELQEYYANKGKESTGKAWLLAVGSLLVTSAVLVGLFMGGRWLYRTITKDDVTTTVTTNQDTKPAGQQNGNGTNTTPSGNDTDTITPTEGTPVQPNDDGSVASGLISGNQSEQRAPGVSPEQSAEQNANAVAARTSIPSTGASETVIVFIASTIAGVFIYRRKALNK